MSWFVLLIWSVIAFEAHLASLQPRIVGGNDTSIENYPYQVALLSNNRFFCGGSLISSSIVLTAAHCVTDESGKLIVRVGSNSAQSGGQTIEVRKSCVHPKYTRSTREYDVSVLQLDHPVSFTDGVDIIKLQPEGIAVPDGSEAVIPGWGRTGTEIIASNLQSLKIYKVSNARCVNLMKPNRITSSMTCYTKSGVNAGACYGDSGGPLVVNGKQVGIISWSKSFCYNSDYPTVFARIEEKSISEHIQKCLKEFS